MAATECTDLAAAAKQVAWVIAHRGGTIERPENTLAAVRPLRRHAGFVRGRCLIGPSVASSLYTKLFVKTFVIEEPYSLR